MQSSRFRFGSSAENKAIYTKSDAVGSSEGSDEVS